MGQRDWKKTPEWRFVISERLPTKGMHTLSIMLETSSPISMLLLRFPGKCFIVLQSKGMAKPLSSWV
ncbi:hypothetical protein D3C79_1040540 [compost metagenome]